MKKIVAVNASPRAEWNTVTLVREADGLIIGTPNYLGDVSGGEVKSIFSWSRDGE